MQQKKIKKMKIKKLFNQIIIPILLINLTVMTNSNIFGQEIKHGFKLIKKQFVKEVNANCYYFEHIKSGAKLFKISNDDENKTFSITFKTLPNSDNGVAHIMEHSVLNGSKNFPVKSPFDVLSKGSLNTFINAFTSRDATQYPFASMNEKDYFNIMHIYLDAVFNPLIYSNKNILKQEGWHHELMDKNSPITYKGVVYNEMKGAMSNPQRELFYHCLKNTYPNNVYGKESGGTPEAIVTLTHQQFEDFHKKYYHPENSYIFLYGNADLDKELEFINSKYLSNYSKTGTKIIIPDQKLFSKPKDATAYYSIMEGADTKDQTYLTLNYIAGKNTQYADIIAMNIVCEILFNQESAPVRLELQKAGIGKNVSAYIQDYGQNYLNITVENANPQDKAKFKEIVYNTLRETIKKGIDKEEIKGIINRYEFSYREGNNAQKGNYYMGEIKTSWMFGNDPFIGLQYEKHLAIVKKALTTNYLESLIQKFILNNNHCVLLSFEPKPGLDKINNENIEKQLDVYKSILTEEQKEKLIKENEELISIQNREDSQDAISTIPLLSLSDIDTKSTYHTAKEGAIGNNKIVYFEEFTNGVIYTNLNFNLKALPQDLIPYASLLSDLLTSMNTQKNSYAELNKKMNINLGGFSTYLTSYLENDNDNYLIPYFVVSFKTMNNNLDIPFDIAKEVILTTKIDDKERLKELISRLKAQNEAAINRNGFGAGYRRFASYISNQNAFNEQIKGLEYYWFLSNLDKNIDNNYNTIVDNINKVIKLLFVKENVLPFTTLTKTDVQKYNLSLEKFLNQLPNDKLQLNDWKFDLVKKNEGIQTSSKVQYAFTGYNFKELGYQWDGKMRVLSKIISTDFLHNQIRVQGGAYGAMCNFGMDGFSYFGSYRDPNLKNTFDVYNKISEFLNSFAADENAMTRYIIGTIGDLDGPETAIDKGNTAFSYYIRKRTNEMVQKDRNAILSCKAADIKSFSNMINDIVSKKVICVYGNSDKINQEKDLFGKLIKIN